MGDTAEGRDQGHTVTAFNRELNDRLATIRDQDLYRELRRVDSPQDHASKSRARRSSTFLRTIIWAGKSPGAEAAIEAVERFGAGSGASRLICGSLSPHHELEKGLAAFKEVEAALTFSSGYAAALGTITALLSKDDIIIVDKLVHACVVDAARLSGAKLRAFAHNDLNDFEDILKWAAKTRNPQAQVLIVTESIFSMDGDAGSLREIVALKDKYTAWLMVDEAHATGLYGANRRGLAEELGVGGQIEIKMGNGKALALRAATFAARAP
jgi:7-keto-8-aminopelargonate synthetase-like enzyme